MTPNTKKQIPPDNEELKAVIAAACSAYLSASNVTFRVASVKNLNEMSLWKKTGLAELMSGYTIQY